MARLRRMNEVLARRVAATLAFIAGPRTLPQNWREIEYFDEIWHKRIQQMAAFIEPGSRVMDLGCGRMWLKDYLTNCNYIPVDYRERGDDTIVCDFNRYEFPKCTANYTFVSGCLEYIEDPGWFVESVSNCSRTCIISYCSKEHFADQRQRAALGWRNSLSSDELIDLFNVHGMLLSVRTITDTRNSIFVFTRSAS